MKIVQLTAENVKKLKVIDITPTKDFIRITGPNGAGKSSVLDAIFYALVGGDAIPEQPIRKGETKAKIRINLGDIVVTRRFSEKGASLTVENDEGFKAPSPQTILDGIIGHLAFDPLEFSYKKPKEQFDILRTISDVKLDMDELMKSEKKDMEARKETNRDITKLEGQISGISVPPDAPQEEVSVFDLMKELNHAEDHNSLVREAEIKRDNYHVTIKNLEDEVRLMESDIAYKKQTIESYQKEALKHVVPEVKPTDDIKSKISNAETLNQAYRAKVQRESLFQQKSKLEKISEDYTAAITKRREDATAAVKAAKMPISGLTLGDNEVIFNDLPFGQLSSAEQLRVSVAIAMAANPKLRVLRIKDGSLLDDNNLKLIQDLAAGQDYQVWIESVDTTGKVGIVMEDGEIKANNEART